MPEKTELKEKTTEEIFELYRLNGEQELKQELVLRYVEVVRTIAIQLRGVYAGFAELDDIVNEGIITLMQAIDRFDVSKNVKFESYASLRIRGAIVDLARKQDWVPRSVRKLGKAIDVTFSELYYQLGRYPTDEEVAAKLNISVEKYQKILGETNLFNILSLDALLDAVKEERHSEAFMRDRNAENMPEADMEKNELEEMMAKAIDSLRENEKLVVSLYYTDELNMKEIANVMGISEPRVSQLHSSAIKKLKLNLSGYVNM